MKPSITVAILGHSSIVREGLRRILSDGDFCVTESVDHPSRLSNQSTDLLVIVDGDLEDGQTENIRALRERFSDTKMVILTEAFNFNSMASAFRAGVHGYIVKEISCEPLIGSLRLVAMGEKVMPSNLADALPFDEMALQRDRDRRTLDLANLSNREREILSCLVMGCPNKVISRRLLISEATVKVHVKTILRKLHVRNRTQAAIRGVNGGFEFHLDGDEAASLEGDDGEESPDDVIANRHREALATPPKAQPTLPFLPWANCGADKDLCGG